MRNINTGWLLVLATLAVFCACDAYAGIVYVSAMSGSDTNNGSSWTMAKETIQAGVDAAARNDTVLVTNGTYNTGGRIPPGQVLCQTRVVIDKEVSVISVNGPSNTFIAGQGPRNENAVRCVWMTRNTVLSGFTLTNGNAAGGAGGDDENGGGIFAQGESSIVSNCIITSCRASIGGGALGCTLNNCTLSGNSADNEGGGAIDSKLNNCTLLGNSATNYGGGAFNGTMNNCTLSGNSGGGAYNGTLNNCTAYGNTNGGLTMLTARNTISFGNTEYEMTTVSAAFCYSNDPQFVDAAAGNLRLHPTSLCIDGGGNAFAPTNETPYDLDGHPRIFNGTVDIGAYEYQGVEYFDLFALAGLHGSITPSGVIRTNQGANVSFVIQPDAYYHVQNIQTNEASAGTATNFTWYDISAPGTVTVSFAATLAARGTPHWWLALWGWTNDFDTIESLDQDGDGLFTWQEYPPNTCPTNANTDGDQYNDGVEVNTGADPLHDDSQAYGAIQNQPAAFNLYTSNSVMDLSYGEVMLRVVSNNVQVRLTMEATDLLDSDGWTNLGPAVEWEYPAPLDKSFFRFLGAPAE